MHQKKKKTAFLMLLLSLGIEVVTGCADGRNTPVAPSAPEQTPEAPAAAPPPPEELQPISPNVAYPSGWSSTLITANSAKTTVTLAGHFMTTRNACGRDAYGSIDLELWNNFTKNMNLAIQNGPGDENCVDPPYDGSRYMDGSVEVELAPSAVAKRTVFELKNGQICSYVKDKAVSDALLNAITQLILAADKEDCPNGWGHDLNPGEPSS